MISIITLLLFLIRIRITSAVSHCFESGNFSNNSIYAQNLNLVLLSLPSSTSIADGLFYNNTVGQDPNKVYVMSLCRADSSPEVCAKCLNSTIQEMREKCPNQKEAYGCLGGSTCNVRYSGRSILGELRLDPTYQGYNTGSITTDMQQFDQTWEGLMARVLTKASAGSSTLKFAAESVKLTWFQNIYTIMQCTPDLTQNDCRDCLGGVVSSYQSCCHGKQGGYVHKPSCFFRWDLYPFYNSSFEVSPPAPAPSPLPLPSDVVNSPAKESGQRRNSSPTVIIAVITSIMFVALVLLSYFLFLKRKPLGLAEGASDVIMAVESLRFDFDTIRTATNDFSDDNKLGQGGFGVVYKGSLANGQAIAVKRLSKDSGQGGLEFKNEVLLVARLEHRNLVRLLGFCLEGEERLLVYELVENSSLDKYIFDSIKRRVLHWEKRYKIITGIARGLLYLHEDSRLRIIHRDLKVSNILLDEEMNPKIADFGMARLFAVDQSQEDTNRIVGTFGYMPPEYVRHGHFSVKSDVFSFGVLVLEIISGQKNSSFSNGEEGDGLLTYAWKNWNEGRATNLIDASLRGGSRSEMIRCINIALLCVQENVADRPTMASVAVMLSSHSITLNVPSKPAFFMYSTIQPNQSTSSSRFSSSLTHHLDESKTESVPLSVNEVSITELYPR